MEKELDVKQRSHSQRLRRRERAQELRQQQTQQENYASPESCDEDGDTRRDRSRPPRPSKRRRSSGSHEEDIIDGFAFSSYSSLNALEADGRFRKQRNRILATRIENGCNLGKYGIEQTMGSSHSSSGRGYMCDSESEDDQASHASSELFTISNRILPTGKKIERNPPAKPASFAACNGKENNISCPEDNSSKNKNEDREAKRSFWHHQPVPYLPFGSSETLNGCTSSYSIGGGHSSFPVYSGSLYTDPTHIPGMFGNNLAAQGTPATVAPIPAPAPMPLGSVNSIPLPGASHLPYGANGHNFPAGQEEPSRHEFNSRLLFNKDSSNVPPYVHQDIHSHQHQHMHQHQHQHQHTHHHSLFPPPSGSFIPPPSTTPHMFNRLPKVDSSTSCYQNPGISFGSIPSHLSSSSNQTTFGSGIHGAFQPKKPGRWCSAHVQLAWYVYNQQQKVKSETQADHLLKTELFNRQPRQIFPTNATTDSFCLNPGGTFSLPFHVGNQNNFFSTSLSHPLGIQPFRSGHPGYRSLYPVNNFPGSTFERETLAFNGFSNNHESWDGLHRTPVRNRTPNSSLNVNNCIGKDFSNEPRGWHSLSQEKKKYIHGITGLSSSEKRKSTFDSLKNDAENYTLDEKFSRTMQNLHPSKSVEEGRVVKVTTRHIEDGSSQSLPSDSCGGRLNVKLKENKPEALEKPLELTSNLEVKALNQENYDGNYKTEGHLDFPRYMSVASYSSSSYNMTSTTNSMNSEIVSSSALGESIYSSWDLSKGVQNTL